jgi:aspartate/methionine/tyrosine aminotransferase
VTGAMKRKGVSDVEEFRKLVLRETGVSFCTRKHFGRPLPGETEQYIRFAYSGIDVSMIKEGMKKLAVFLA